MFCPPATTDGGRACREFDMATRYEHHLTATGEPQDIVLLRCLLIDTDAQTARIGGCSTYDARIVRLDDMPFRRMEEVEALVAANRYVHLEWRSRASLSAEVRVILGLWPALEAQLIIYAGDTDWSEVSHYEGGVTKGATSGDYQDGHMAAWGERDPTTEGSEEEEEAKG
jgi:hypothetical protein